MSALDQYRIDKSAPIKLGVGRPAFFMVSDDEGKRVLAGDFETIEVGRCKKALLHRTGPSMNMEVSQADDAERITRRLTYLMTADYSVGLAIIRLKGKATLVAYLFSSEDVQDASAAFEEMDDTDEEERPAYMVRDRDTGEEYLMFDPPGGSFREMGDEYSATEDWGGKNRDRRDGFWKNGECLAFYPEGAARAFMESIDKSRLIALPRLDRSMVWPDGYEVIEEGSLEGWRVWKWCEANCRGAWFWYNLDGKGPWLELANLSDVAAFAQAFPDIVQAP